MDTNEDKKLELSVKLSNSINEVKKIELIHKVEKVPLSNQAKKFEILSKVNPLLNIIKKEELNYKIEEVDGQVEEFFNKCHGPAGRFCSSPGGSDAAKPKSASRSWINKPGKQPMVIVYHDATRAGPHVDVHIGKLSMIYRVKPELQEKLKFAKDGNLTADSKKAILQHVKNETQNRSRVPQNLDHGLEEARTSWTKGDPADKSYGAGKTRQVIHESEVNVYKASGDGPVELYAPALNPDKGMYIHKLYPGDDKRAPILVWGSKSARSPKFEERLKLKSISEDEMSKLEDMHTTVKYDGASAYVAITPKGTTVWSPRTRKATGEQIEYTPKLGEVSNVKSKETITGMGELLFRDKNGEYISAAKIGGVLNSHKLIPEDLKPEIRLYRIDKVGRKSTYHLPFEENRAIQKKVAKLSPKHFKVVETIKVSDIKKTHEGVVAVPKWKSVNQGYKLKRRSDPNDWRLDKVAYKPGDKGGIAGVAYLTSLDSGKQYKLGPGQMGNHKLVRNMMKNPNDYVGTVVKVHSHHGHEGRSSKVIDFHLDKGVAAPVLEDDEKVKGLAR